MGLTDKQRNKIADVLQQWSEERTAHAQGILLEKNAIATRALMQSILAGKSTIQGDTISIGISAEDYYKYVDEGVQGTQNKRPNTGRFRFDMSKKAIPLRVALQWTIDAKYKIYGFRNNVLGKAGEKMSEAQKDKSFAYIISRSIHRKGIRRTDFWSDTFNDAAFKDLGDRIAKAIGGEYVLDIKSI